MPRAKRKLAEADINVLGSLSNHKPLKSAPAGGTESESESDIDDECTRRREDYKNKDNSKLRVFLEDRALPSTGTREEMIKLLENSSIEYEALATTELVKKLKRRSEPCYGPRDAKIARLKQDDEIDNHSGDYRGGLLDGMAKGRELELDQLVAKQSAISTGRYSSLRSGELSELLSERKLTQNGTKSAMIARLEKDDQHRKIIRPSSDLAEKIQVAQSKYDIAMSELEKHTGHPPRSETGIQTPRECPVEAQKLKTVKHICDYNWKDSHWAARSQRELQEICSPLRRNMPGSGPKATMIKWLETGSVDYEDLYVSSLEAICEERGLSYRGATRAELARRLNEYDEKSNAD